MGSGIIYNSCLNAIFLTNKPPGATVGIRWPPHSVNWRNAFQVVLRQHQQHCDAPKHSAASQWIWICQPDHFAILYLGFDQDSILSEGKDLAPHQDSAWRKRKARDFSRWTRSSKGRLDNLRPWRKTCIYNWAFRFWCLARSSSIFQECHCL